MDGAQNGPKIWLEPADHTALHNHMRKNKAWFRQDAEAFRKLDRVEQHQIIEGGLIEAGIDTSDPRVQVMIDESIDMSGQNDKGRTRGGRTRGKKMYDPPRYRPPNSKIGVDPRTGKFSKKRFRRDTGGKGGRGFKRGMGNGGRGALFAGAGIVLGLYAGDAAAQYEELLDLSLRVDARRGGPSLYEEIEALSIISDLNVALGGNVMTIYGGWNYWRSIHGASTRGDSNAWWAQ